MLDGLLIGLRSGSARLIVRDAASGDSRSKVAREQGVSFAKSQPAGPEGMTLSLPPGEYRAKLRTSDHEDIEKQDFKIEAPRVRQEAGQGAFDGFTENAEDIIVRERAEVELKLIIDGPDRDPRFAISLYPQGGAEQQRNLSIRDEVHDGWFLTEYNQNSQTVTLSDSTQVIILERGKRMLLPIATKPVEPAQ